MKKFLNNYLYTVFILAVVFAVTMGYRICTGGEEHGYEGGYFFIKNELSTQIRYEKYNEFDKHKLISDSFYAWNHNNNADDYVQYQLLKQKGYGTALQCISYQYHWLNFIPLLMIFGMIYSFLFWMKTVLSPRFFIGLMTMPFIYIVAIDSYEAHTNPGWFKGLAAMIFTIFYVMILLFCFLLRKKNQFHTNFFYALFILISIGLADTAYSFMELNAHYKSEYDKILSEQKQRDEEMKLLNYPAVEKRNP